MKKTINKILFFLILSNIMIAQRTVISLNGQVDFDQTIDAFPPDNFTRKIPVPGLIDLAEPKIEQYDKYFDGTFDARYSWYKFTVDIPRKMKGQFATLQLLKSRYNTQIICNGHDMGTYMQCNTPIETNLTSHLQYGKTNTILIRLGDRHSLPKEAATGFDREKYSDIPGIWDDINIIFSGPIQINRVLALPDYANKKIISRVKLENLHTLVERNMEYSEIEYTLTYKVKNKKTGSYLGQAKTIDGKIHCQSAETISLEIPIKDAHPWSPNDPFLYELEVEVSPKGLFFNNYGNKESLNPNTKYDWIGKRDKTSVSFGMRDFKSKGNHFMLNGERISLFGSTITLNRFFEDPDRAALPWNKAWVKNLFIDIPKSMNWNFMRVSIGLLPSFWYDLADEYGIILQNEYPMWNLRGRASQYQQEYTDWVWTDGNHPSIVIWDALNEQKQNYIGNKLIPELQELDPTRIWDAGWTELDNKQMDEIHWYPFALGWWWTDKQYMDHRNSFQFGGLFEKYFAMDWFENTHTPIILNEYGWLWQDRDGLRSGVRTRGAFDDKDRLPFRKNYEYYDPSGKQLYKNRDVYNYFVGEHASADDRWQFQSYMMAIEGEILRSTRKIAGLASFALISNNGGYTGDWFKEPISELIPTPALLAQYHTHQAFAAFLDVQDGRYLKNPKVYTPNEPLTIDIFAMNDLAVKQTGILTLSIIDSNGKEEKLNTENIELDPFWQKKITYCSNLPTKEGGYMLLTKLKTKSGIDQVSRRYIRIGNQKEMKFWDYEYESTVINR